MARANIDLSFLAGLLTKTPTAANSVNPDYSAEESVPYQDPVTGNISGVMPNNTPYTPPSQWQRLVHPEQANVIDSLNNQAVSKPLSASLDNQTQIGIRSGNYSRLPHQLQAPTLTPEQAAIAGYGDFSPPTIINQYNKSLAEAGAGVPTTQAATTAVQSGTDLKTAIGEAGRKDVEESVLDQDTLNHWFKSFHLTPMESQLAEKQLKSEMGVQPLVAQIRERALQNQKNEETNIVPAQQNLSLTQTQNAQNIASEQGKMWDFTKTALDNRMIGEAAQSHYLPEMERFSNTIQPDGSIKPFTKNPLGASPFAIQMGSLGDINGKVAGETIKDSHGKSYVIPTAPPSNIDPLTGGSIAPSGAPVISSTTGPTVMHDTSGSMSPPVSQSLSSTTFPQSEPQSIDDIKAEMDRIEVAANLYPSSMSGVRFKYLKSKYDELLNKQSYNTGHIIPSGFSIPSYLR